MNPFNRKPEAIPDPNRMQRLFGSQALLLINIACKMNGDTEEATIMHSI